MYYTGILLLNLFRHIIVFIEYIVISASKTFKRHANSDEHNLALSNKQNSAAAPFIDQIGVNINCTPVKTLFYSNPPVSYRIKSATFCVLHNKNFWHCLLCKEKGVKGAGSSLCDKQSIQSSLFLD